ncbi:MAG TPA: DNA-3-methyladenine glycosylase I [Caulobacteraceae bacterium]|nr:DNA-3-methyladenine glycosylase I [Caulobacteraceae bacterium]
MGRFAGIYAIAAQRKGGDAALEALIAEHAPKSKAEIAATPDDRILAMMSERVFQAGFNWRVVANMWKGFEVAFHGFDPSWCGAMTEEEFDALLKDTRIVRNAQKILSVQANGRFLVELAKEHGTAAKAFAAWPDDDYAGLLDLLKTRASRLGGEAGMRFVRSLGKPSFITSRDVAAALIREGVLAKPPSGKKDLRAIQDAFNGWAKESGRDLTAISRVLAMSVG